MTRVDFYHNAPGRLETAVRIAGKAFRQGLSMLIYAPDDRLREQMDRLLWSMVPGSFLPHCGAQHELAAQTPILLTRIMSADEPLHHDALLINLADEIPPAFSRFERLVELVANDEAEKVQGRIRYQHYRDRGYEVSAHDLSRSSA